MLDSIFMGVLPSAEAAAIPVTAYMICIVSALLVGFVISGLYTIQNRYTKSFVMTLTTLPAAVAMVIIMVNGSVGTGVAVAGAFSLIRFRSVPGTAREISAIFLAMGSGLAMGLGYIAFGFLFAILLSGVNVALGASSFGEQKTSHRTLNITLPEHLDYQEVFTDVFDKFTNNADLVSVKTTSMGSLLKLIYDVDLKGENKEKAFLDELRTRNGNLEISLTRQTTIPTEL